MPCLRPKLSFEEPVKTCSRDSVSKHPVGAGKEISGRIEVEMKTSCHDGSENQKSHPAIGHIFVCCRNYRTVMSKLQVTNKNS